MKKAFLLITLLSFPLTAFAAGGELDWKTFGWRVAMFIIFAALLYFLTAKRIKAMLIQRTEDIKAALAEAETAKEEAMAKVKEYEAKMVELEKELEDMKANAKKVAESERAGMIADAKKHVEQMKQFAINMIESEKERAIQELHHEAVELVASQAEQKLIKEINGSKAAKILDEYVKRIGE